MCRFNLVFVHFGRWLNDYEACSILAGRSARLSVKWLCPFLLCLLDGHEVVWGLLFTFCSMVIETSDNQCFKTCAGRSQMLHNEILGLWNLQKWSFFYSKMEIPWSLWRAFIWPPLLCIGHEFDAIVVMSFNGKQTIHTYFQPNTLNNFS